MRITITRYLKTDRTDKNGLQKIHMRVCWAGTKIRFSTGESVNPAHWYAGTDQDDDANRGRVLKSGGITGKNINRRLSIYTVELEKFFDSRLTIPREVEVQTEVERIRTQCLGYQPKPELLPTAVLAKPAVIGIADFVQTYKAEMRADRSESWREMVSVVGDHLTAFRAGIDWPQLTLPVLNQFKVYLQEEMEHSDATLKAYIATLRGMLKYAGRSGVPVPPDWAYMEVRQPGDSIRPELTYPEMIRLADASLLNVEIDSEVLTTSVLEETRWYFLIACATGLRHSDLWQMQSPTITRIEGIPCVEVHQQKTNGKVPVPLNEEVIELLRHPAKNRPVPLYMYNRALKPIGVAAELDRSVMVGTYYAGNLQAEYMPLHQIINSHTARRTFATLMTSGGMSTRTLQIIMGHSSITSTEKYAKVTNQTLVRQTMESWKNSRQIVEVAV